MSHPALVPRPDQVAELTRGLDLPLAPIAEPLMRVLAEAMATAFAGIRADWPQEMATASEPEITSLLFSRLSAMTEGGSGPALLWRTLIRSIARGAECINYDGTKLEKKPDLTFCLSARASRFPLVAEAKLLDAPRGKTEALYCSKGVQRYLVGEYGWGGREAFMLGYVRDGSTIATKLAPFLATANHAQTYRVKLGPVALSSAGNLARSEHDRHFAFTHVPPPDNVPGPIALWHLWLDVI